MKTISLDFRNRFLSHDFGPDSNGTQYMTDDALTKQAIRPYLPDPELYDVADSFTFDFEINEVSINRPVIYSDSYCETDHLDCFVPIKTFQAPGLCDKFDQFLSDIGMEQINLSEDPEFQSFISDLFGEIM